HLVGDAKHLEELARGLSLMGRSFVTENQDRIRKRDFLARTKGRSRISFARRRDGGQISQFRPVSTDDPIRLRPGRAEVVVQRSEVLEIEDVAKRRIFETEVSQT